MPKHHIRIKTYGTVDELNSFLGLLRDGLEDERIRAEILEIQNRLFTIGASLAAENEKAKNFKPDLLPEDVELLESRIDSMTEQLPPMRFFILPGGHHTISTCHICRTICRRAERQVSELNDLEPIEDIVIIYLNRLSDYLFILGRKIAHIKNITEIPWKGRKQD